jgi:hypothetical protein
VRNVGRVTLVVLSDGTPPSAGSTPHSGLAVSAAVTPLIFVLGVSCVLLALLFECPELRIGLKTILLETADAVRPPGRLGP